MVTVRQCWPLVCIAALIFCCVLLQMDHTQVTTVYPKATVLHNDSLSKNKAPTFNCTANNHAVLANVPKLHQEFLRYKHCRAFPTLLSPSPCEDDLYLLLVIKSTAIQIERRAALRETWAHPTHINGRRVKLVFLMGRSQDHVGSYDLQPLLEWENRRHNDILQWDFVDSFFNLTLKEVGFLSWFSQSCSSAHFVYKGDDDVFVNTGNMFEFLREHNPDKHLVTGQILINTWPSRWKIGKYYIPVEMFPNEPYPPYPGGGGYLMSRHTVLGLDEAAKTIELFPIDDAYVGFCLKKMGVSPIPHQGFMMLGIKDGNMRFNPCVYRDIMLLHKLNPVEMWAMWALMRGTSLHCEKGRTILEAKPIF